MSKIYLCGVRIDDLTLEEAIDRALSLHNRPCTVFTPNAVMLDACRRNRKLSRLLNRSDLSLPDGVGVLSAAAKKGFFFQERVPGIDFGEAILERASKEGLRVFLLGGKEGVARRAAANLSTKYPGLRICGAHSGYFQKSGTENDGILLRLREARPQILFVCFGFPIQEEWIVTNLPFLSTVRLIAGLGGSLDVWAGDARRAPKAVQGLGLEWAWRMIREPKRLKNLPALVRFSWFS